MKRLAFAVALLAGLCLAAPSVGAAKPPDSITLNQAAPQYGDTITFTYSYNGHVNSANPHLSVRLDCDEHYWIARASLAVSPGVGLTDWWLPAGAYDCTAELAYGFPAVVLATTAFHIDA